MCKESGENMYNEVVKKQFIENLSSESAIQNYHTLFSQVESLEIEHDEDIYNLPLDIIAKYIMENTTVSCINSLKTKMGRVNTYKRWALVENLINEDVRYFENDRKLIAETFERYSKTYLFSSPADLKMQIDKYLNQKNDMGVTTDELSAAYLMLLFQGFSQEEIFQIKLDNIKLTKSYMAIMNEDKIISIHKEFIDLLSKIYTQRTYIGNKKKQQICNKMSDRYIDDGFDYNDHYMKVKILKKISTKMKKELAFNTNDVYLMGRIYDFKLHYPYEKLTPTAWKELYFNCYNSMIIEPMRINKLRKMYKAL